MRFVELLNRVFRPPGGWWGMGYLKCGCVWYVAMAIGLFVFFQIVLDMKMLELQFCFAQYNIISSDVGIRVSLIFYQRITKSCRHFRRGVTY